MPADKSYVIDKLELIATLLEILGENSFKTRAYTRAAQALEALDDDLETLIRSGRLGNVDGIGAALNEKIRDMYETGTCDLLERLEKQVPEGVVEMTRVKGLGPKKIAHIWQQMGITSVGELLYACQENRLREEKGFGDKTQENIRRSIEFQQQQQGLFHYYRVRELANRVEKIVREHCSAGMRFSECGELRRCLPVLSAADFLIEAKDTDQLSRALEKSGEFLFKGEEENCQTWQLKDSRMKLRFHVAEGNFYSALLKATGSASHLEALGSIPGKEYGSEQEIYESLGMSWIEPEMREGMGETESAKKGPMPRLVDFSDLRGMLHNHSTWSDGLHSIEEMSNFCIQLGLEYFGISDHSRSAAYAGGLSEGRIEQQHIEIDKLNAKLAPFRILKSIESDILADGSLDYPASVLKTFDFVVASVHSGLNMDEEKATERLIRAIENPYTHILGHPTGRLLLSRAGYPINHKKIIDACAANTVAIELNANPYRLDIDWTWIPYAMKKGVRISINPDAHKKEGLLDANWGIAAARKGGLTPEMTLNALSLSDLLAFFSAKK